MTLSFNKAKWIINDPLLEPVEQIMRMHDVPEVVARIIVGRGLSDIDLDEFLRPTLRDHFPDPFKMAGMEEMALDLADDIKSGKNIAIFGDFDVDGATSSAILHRFLKACGVDAPIYIPDRLTEGYGPNIVALQELKSKGAEVLFLLDCGTTAFDIVEQGAELGLKIIILDHHEAEDTLPAAAHVINPKRKDDHSGFDVLAACGVTFLACVAINNKLRAADFYMNRNEPDMRSFLDLVALGTVCDMVPLKSPNRLLVRSGFEQAKRSKNIGLKALMNVSSIEDDLSTYHCGYMLGPRINAGSRVHQADLGAKLLSTEDEEEANNIAWTLNDCNDKRKGIQASMEREAIAQIEALGLDQYPVIIVGDEGWHAGLSGLVAGRIKEKYKKPAIAVTYAGNIHGEIEGRGSGRSVHGVHIAQAFIDARNAGIIEKGGGHAMAGGFTVAPEKLDALKEFLIDHVQRQLEGQDSLVELEIDAPLTVRGVTPDLIKKMGAQLGPFGQEFEEPLFVFKNVRVYTADILGEKHLKLMIGDGEGGTRIKAMAFGAVGTDIGEAFIKSGKSNFDIAGRLKINRWQGRESAEIHLVDARFTA